MCCSALCSWDPTRLMFSRRQACLHKKVALFQLDTPHYSAANVLHASIPKGQQDPINVLSKCHLRGYWLQYGRGSENLSAEQPCGALPFEAFGQLHTRSAPCQAGPPYRVDLAPGGMPPRDSILRDKSESYVCSNKLFFCL